jgi:hypothetical protein
MFKRQQQELIEVMTAKIRNSQQSRLNISTSFLQNYNSAADAEPHGFQ